MVYDSVYGPSVEITVNQFCTIRTDKVEHDERDAKHHKTHSEEGNEVFDVFDGCLEELYVESCAVK